VALIGCEIGCAQSPPRGGRPGCIKKRVIFACRLARASGTRFNAQYNAGFKLKPRCTFFGSAFGAASSRTAFPCAARLRRFAKDDNHRWVPPGLKPALFAHSTARLKPCPFNQIKASCTLFGVPSVRLLGEPRIPPLRFASVGMTNQSACAFGTVFI